MHPLERAIEIAVDAHKNQTDKADEVYILHPLRVMLEQDSEPAMITAILHDVVEDSDRTIDDLKDDEVEFPRESMEALKLLTRSDAESYDEFVQRAGRHPIARSVKRADIEDNMDLTRLDSVEDDQTKERLEKYHRSWQYLRNLESAD